MAIKDIYTNTHCGTKQNDRMPKALADDYIRIDERSLEDLVFQVAEFAKHVTFYDGSDPKSTWHDFFDFASKADVIAKISQQIEEGAVSPHMALLLAFLKLYGKEQAQLNTLLKRNREFYYKEVLGFTPRKGSIGTVPIFFQLTKSESSVFLPKGTLFDAGKDSESRPIYYSTTDDVTLSKAQITRCIKYIDDKLYNIELDEERTAVISSDACIHYIYLPIPELDKLDGNISINCLKEISVIKAEYTTIEGWREFTAKRFPLSINADEPHFSIYNQKVHSGTLDFNTPLIRLSCYNITDVQKIMDATKSLSFSVTDSENIIITNRYGIVANNKGVQPFGAICQEGDSFTIEFPFTILQKQIEKGQISDNADKAFVDITFKTKQKNAIKTITTTSADWKLNKHDSRSCIVELGNNTYNQLDYQLNFAKFIASQMEGSKLDQTEEPVHYSILELQRPIKVAYSFCIYNIQQRIITTQLSEVLIHNFNNFFQKDDHIVSELYFHLSNTSEAKPLSIHFLMDTFEKCQIRAKRWSYYDGSQWNNLTRSDVIKDSTDGLCRSGIVVLNINADNVEWLKASFDEHNEFKQLQRIRTQTAELVFDSIASQGKPPVGISLHAGTISKPKTAIPGIKTVVQPYDGNRADCDETHLQFECRVSEYLRHKGRAWTAWDYERLVLEHFPNIASVRCYPSSNSEGQLTPGSVFLVVIPQLDTCHQDTPLTPHVDSDTLNDIEAYLKTVRSEHISITVENPQYDEIRVTCTISLCPDCIDKEYYTTMLDTALKMFLAPWTDATQTGIGNKSKLNESDIVAFIQQQPYVDKIWCIQVKIIEHEVRQGTKAQIIEHEVRQGTDIQPSNIGHLLTSAKDHEINIKSNDEI